MTQRWVLRRGRQIVAWERPPFPLMRPLARNENRFLQRVCVMACESNLVFENTSRVVQIHNRLLIDFSEEIQLFRDYIPLAMGRIVSAH